VELGDCVGRNAPLLVWLAVVEQADPLLPMKSLTVEDMAQEGRKNLSSPHVSEYNNAK
jgi:hypothetical protein